MMTYSSILYFRLRIIVLAILAKPYSGAVVGTAIGSVAALLLTAGLVFDLSWVATWKIIGFPGALPPFYDMHAVTNAAADCATATYPFLNQGCNPWGRFNYPPVWLLLGRLGVNGSHTILLAALIETPALILLVTILSGRSVRAGLLSLLLVFSPSTVLAYERGNVEILEWSLICAAALIFREDNRVRACAAFALLAAGVMLKFLATFCCIAFIRFRFAIIAVSAALLLVSASYVYSLSDVLQIIRRSTPVSPYISYGYPIIFDRLEFFYAPRLGFDFTGLSKSSLPISVVTLVVLGAVACAFRVWRSMRNLLRIDDGSTGLNFLFGSGVYCGSFLLLSTNYTYRLIFLLLCLPQLFEWIEGKNVVDQGSRRIAVVLYGCCVISMWLKFHPELTLHINQISDWVIFAVFTAILVLNMLRAASERVPKSFFARWRRSDR